MQDDKTTKLQFAGVLNAVMTGIYDKRELSKEVLGMWFLALQRFELDDVQRALSRHVNDTDRGQFAPKPAEIIRQLEGSAAGAAPLAWGKVQKAAAQVGAYNNVVFDDAAIHAAIGDLGGWPEICRCNIDELPFLQRRFEASYRAYRERGAFEYSPRMHGIHSIENGGRSEHGEIGAVFIGDPDKCRLVLERGNAGGTLRLSREGQPPMKDAGPLRSLGNVIAGSPLLRLVKSARQEDAA